MVSLPAIEMRAPNAQRGDPKSLRPVTKNTKAPQSLRETPTSNTIKPCSDFPKRFHRERLDRIVHHFGNRGLPCRLPSQRTSKPWLMVPILPTSLRSCRTAHRKVVPVWVGREREHLLICTGENSLKARNTRRDPRIALSIIDFHDPYREVQIRGRVVERRPDGDCKYIDVISRKYTGKPFPFRQPEGRIALVIEIEKARFTKLPFEHTPPK